MMNLLPLILVMLHGTWALAAPVCGYSLSLSNATVQITDTIQVVQQNISLERSSNNSIFCENYRMFFGKGLANSYQRKAFSSSNKSVTYNLHSNVNMNGVLKDFDDAVSSTEYLQSNLPARNTSYANHFFISIPSTDTQNSPDSGTYTDNVQVSVYSLGPVPGSLNLEKVTTLTVALVVNKKIDLSLVDEGGVFDPSSTSKVLDFGYLEQNQEKGVDLRVVSNTSYKVLLSSANGGSLKHSQGDSIAYQLSVNGSPVSLANSQSSPVSVGDGVTTSSTGDRYNLKVKITGSTSDKVSGLYQDVVTVTAMAN